MHRKILDRIYALNPSAIKLGLENISQLLAGLGNPHTKFPAIHIAGTNGKGSTAFFLNSIFKAAGYKTGMYLSPHLMDIRERITICSTKIPEKNFEELANNLFCLMEKKKLPATFFEFITAMAFLYFRQEKIDIGIIEVGMGGRLDATNVLVPLVSIITEIALEHTLALGTSIRKIAGEKGGIIKQGGAVFISSENKETVAVLKNISKRQKAICFQYGKNYLVESSVNQGLPQNFSLIFQGEKIDKLSIEIPGGYQIKNSSTAASAALFLSEKYKAINKNSVSKGLRSAKIPARMELAQKSPQVVIDAAHNHQSITALIENIPVFFRYNKLIALLGILKDKDFKKIIQALSSRVDIFIMTEPKTERALPARLLEQSAGAFRKTTFIEKEVSKALERAKEIAEPEDLILVTGSYYTAGEALSWMKKPGII